MDLSKPFRGLDRHQQRRDVGLPTVSVLASAAGDALAEIQRWAEQGQRPFVTLSRPHVEEVRQAWFNGVMAGVDLFRSAVSWLARRMATTTDDLAARLERMTPFELDALFDTLPAEAAESSAEALCRKIVTRSIQGESQVGPDRLTQLREDLAGADGVEAWQGLAVALRAMLSPAVTPVVLLARLGDESRAEPDTWFAAAAESLARLALEQTWLTTIVVVDPHVLEAYLRHAPESRTKALIRAGTIRGTQGIGELEIARRLEAVVPGGGERLGDTVRRLASDGASEQLVRSFLDAATAGAHTTSFGNSPSASEGSERDDPARSAAERFLFERLASLPATAGLFELNVSLDFRFGPTRPMEVDLLARTLGVAVEVDGYYHFQNADAYRRDRRKDLALQSRGYLVVRILAEDVVARLEEVLTMIEEAVAVRGGRPDSHRQRGEMQ